MKINPLPPGPAQSRIGEYLLALRRTDALGFMLGVARRYGDVACFRAGGQRYYLLNHPDYVRDVLVTREENFLKGRGPRRGVQLLGEGLIVSEGDEHRRQRRLMQPAFHRQRVEGYARVMVEQAEQACERWRDGATFDAAQEMRRVTLSVVCQTLFGTGAVGEAEEADRAMTDVLKHFRAFRVAPAHILERLPLPESRRFRGAWERLDRMIYRMIAERRREGGDRGDLLSMLLLARDEEGGGALTDAQVRDQAMTIFLAGYESTALTLAWAWYLLARNPEAEARLHEELDAVLGGRLPTYEDLPRLEYAGRVLNESMRLYPPAWRLVRWAIDDCEFGGYVIPAGSQVIVSQYVMHHDERYFPDPFHFDPERWAPEARAARPQYSFFPFGAGRRRCLGEVFALMEGVLLLATLARRWRLRLAPAGLPVEMQALHMLRPKRGIHMRLERRG
jgi:cytochrome P450